MEQEVLRKAAENGIWALLFVALFIYVLKMNEKREERLITQSGTREERLLTESKVREERLMNCLDQMGVKYDGISKELCVIKEEVQEIGKDVEAILRN